MLERWSLLGTQNPDISQHVDLNMHATMFFFFLKARQVNLGGLGDLDGWLPEVSGNGMLEVVEMRMASILLVGRSDADA